MLKDTRELGSLRTLDANAEKIFGDGKLAAFHEANVARSKALAEGDPALRSLTAEVHPLAVQGETLGIHYDPTIEHVDNGRVSRVPMKGADLERYQRWYIGRVRQAARAKGLPEPLYFRHQAHPVVGHGDRTAGNVFKAVAGVHQSGLKLFREGRAYTGPEVLVSGMAKNIKRKHQWQGVADAYDRHTLPWSREKSPRQIMEGLYHRGLDPNDYVFVNFGRFRQASSRAGHAAETDAPELGSSLDVKSFKDIATAEKAGDERFLETRGFSAVPRNAGNELRANTAPPNPVSRVAGKFQGIQSGAILGLNPSWLQMQVAANALQAGVGMGGNVKDLLAGSRAYKALSEADRKIVDEATGIGVYQGHTQTPHLGSVGDRSSWVQHARRLGEVPIIRTRRGAVRVTDVNPMNVMFHADDLQNRAFRRAVFYNAAKREAFKSMGRELGAAQATQARVSQLLRLKPGEDLQAQLHRVLNNAPLVEKLADHTDHVLGDYLRYTSRERRLLKPTVLFYGFLRYALKTLFYTLPVKHPIAGALAAKVGQLHDEEVRRIFGSRDVPPWIFTRMYQFDANGNVRKDSSGRPLYTDLARINPVTNPIVDVAQEGPKALAGLVSPMIQAVTDQVYGQSSFTGQRFHVNGSAEDNPNPDLGTRGRIVANSLLSAAFPYREAKKLAYPAKQGDDSLLFSQRPIAYRTPGPQQKEANRRAALPSTGRQLVQDLLPLGAPKADTTGEYLAAHPRTPAAGGGADGIDWRSVDWSGGAADIDWSSVDWSQPR